MATQHADEVPDPIDQELARLLADPEIRQSLDESAARFERGETDGVDHNEARRIVGLAPPPPSNAEQRFDRCSSGSYGSRLHELP